MGRTDRRSASSSSAIRATRVSRRAITGSTLLLRCDTVQATNSISISQLTVKPWCRTRAVRTSIRSPRGQERTSRFFSVRRIEHSPRMGPAGYSVVRVVSLISDDRLKEADNLLLPGGHDVELPANLGEAVVDMVTEVGEVLPEVDEVLPKGVETSVGGPVEFADFAAELADVAVGGSGEATRAAAASCPLACTRPVKSRTCSSRALTRDSRSPDSTGRA